jgi:WD40 repeat protein
VVVTIPGKAMRLPAAATEETRAIRPCHKFEGHTEGVTDVIHVAGGHRMMTCSWDGSLRVWDLQSGKQIGNDWRDGEERSLLNGWGTQVMSGVCVGVETVGE